MRRALPLSWRRALLFGSAAVCMAAAPPAAQAHEHQQGKVLSRARFLHAVPMAAPATLIVHGHPPRIHSSYGHPSAYFDCHPGPARVELKVEGQAKPAATAELEIGRGRYTVIAVPAASATPCSDTIDPPAPLGRVIDRSWRPGGTDA